jgi:hypothetical protein
VRESLAAMRKKFNQRLLEFVRSTRSFLCQLNHNSSVGKSACVLYLAISLAGFASAQVQEPLELSDGRVFQSWSVIRQTDDSITVRHSKGAAKIMKELLPPDVLAKYPVIREPVPVVPSLPPEPQGLDKPTKGERSISARDTISDTDVRWTCRAAVKGTDGGITRTSKNRAGEFKTDFVIPFGLDDVVPLEEAIAKARKWSLAVADKKPPSFDKSMGEVLGHEWTFSWDTERVVVHTGLSDVARFEEQDLVKIQVLLAALPHMEKERRDEAKAGEDFAATLK